MTALPTYPAHGARQGWDRVYAPDAAWAEMVAYAATMTGHTVGCTCVACDEQRAAARDIAGGAR